MLILSNLCLTLSDNKCQGTHIDQGANMNIFGIVAGGAMNASNYDPSWVVFDPAMTDCAEDKDPCTLIVNSWYPSYNGTDINMAMCNANPTWKDRKHIPVGLCDQQGALYECDGEGKYRVLYYKNDDCTGTVYGPYWYDDGCESFPEIDRDDGMYTSVEFVEIKVKDCGCLSLSLVLAYALAAFMFLLN